MSEQEQPNPGESPQPNPNPSPNPEPKPGETPKPDDKKPDTSLAADLAKPPEKKEDDKKDAPKAPEKYEFKLPDGYELDTKVSEEAEVLFKKHNLSQESAQELVDFYVSKTNAAAEAPYDVWADTQAEWVKQIKADPEIGGKLDEVRANIARTIDLLPAELAAQFREAMVFTGAGNNPAFVKGFNILAGMLTEGKHVNANQPSKAGQTPPGQGRPSAAKALYPDLPSKA